MTFDFLFNVSLAGVMATYGLLVIANWAYRLGLPRLDFAKAMAALTYGPSFDGEPPYWAGQLVIYFNGVMLALIYATVVAEHLPGIPLVKGIIWGVVLYSISCVFFVPLYLREGFFLWHIDKKAWITSGMAHGVWGLVVGWLSPIA